MYFGLPYAVQAISLFVLIAIIQLFTKGANKLNAVNKILIIPIVFYLLHAISLFYSDNTADAKFDLQVKLSFLILPLIFALEKAENKIDFSKLIKSYIYISGLFSVLLLILNIIVYFQTGSFNYYMMFSVFMHPSYMALYLVVNVLFISIVTIKNKTINPIYIASLLLSLIVIYFSESKAGLISVFALIIFVLYKSLYVRYKKQTIMAVAFIFLGFSLLLVFNPRFKALSYSLSNYEETFAHPEKVKESTALRILVWDASIRIIKKNPVIGVGSGDIKDELIKIYKERNYKMPLELQINSHNQFLETTVGQGIIGLILLLSMLFVPLFVPLENKFLMQGFILIISINLLFESMFNTQAGVVFFAFIYSFIVSAKSKETT